MLATPEFTDRTLLGAARPARWHENSTRDLVFERLFRAAHPRKGTAQRDSLLLDRVLGDAQELKGELGASDRQRMDEYLQSVRSIEKRLETLTTANAILGSLAHRLADKQRPPADPPEQYLEHVQLMLDMIALAFQTDTTRVCTFMFGNAVSGRNFSFFGRSQRGTS